MKKANIVFIGAFCALISIINADSSETTNGEPPAVVEKPIQKLYVLQPGEKEYLSPNLIGVQNIAVTNIPETMNFINIIDAYREVVDGVRYEIVLNAVNTTDNNTEVVCRLVVLEKPWLTTLWGDKVRLLQESNCTSEVLPDLARDRKSLQEKYQTNAIFSGSRNELTNGEMSNLESQIFGPQSKNPQLTRQRSANQPRPTTESINAQTTEVAKSEVILSEASSGDAKNAGDSVVSSSEPTTTEQIPELSNNEQKWLDDFLSVGAYNFETSLEKQKANRVINQAQSNGQESDKEKPTTAPVVGGTGQLSEEDLKLEIENLSKSLTKLASGDSPPPLNLDKCHSGSRQIVAGTLVKLDCDMIDDQTGIKDRCLMSLWSRPWLKEDGYEVTFECRDSPKSVHRHSRSIGDEFQRKKRETLVGGVSQMSDEDLKKAVENLSISLTKLASGDSPPSLSLDKCHSGSKQVVAGSISKLDCDMVDSLTGKKHRCTVSIWSQPWLKEDGYEVTFECKDRPKSVHRHSRSVGEELFKRSKREEKHRGGVKPLTDFELNAQAERISQSLAKIASGDGPSYSISRSFNGTKQTVAGTLVKIYCELVDGNTGGKENCTVSLWSRPWIPIDGYELTFECNNKQKTVHRHSRAVEYIEKKKNFKKSHDSLDKAEHLFQKFTTKFNKKYHNSMERQMRLRIFKHNLKLIYDLNKNEMGSAKYGITEFADMTTTEYRERTGLLSREEGNSVRSQAIIPNVELPKEFDWREKGAISKVKNQGNCGSCWAFSVTGNIEGLHAVKTGKLEEYSEQELLDCDTVDSACNGGLPDNAYEAIEKIGGLELESEYPYQAKKGQCHFNNTLSRVKLSGAVDLPKNETQMAQWLIVNGPISIGINANAMQFYRGGVSHPWKMLCSKKSLDHGVLIVGYGVSEYPKFKKILPYWIVKNSWGPKWGEQGYYRVYRGDNTCGVSEMPTSAVLA